MTSSKEGFPPPTLSDGDANGEMTSRHFANLLATGEHEFDLEIKTLDVRELLGLIACLQREMALEQRHFDRLNTQFQNRKAGFQGPKEEEEAMELSASLCRSQIRLAQLCNRNMRCFTQQAARAQQDRSSENLKKSSSVPSPTSTIKETIWQNKVEKNESVNNNVSDEENHEISGNGDHFDPSAKTLTVWKRAPSVEDILQSVRAMRQEKDGSEEKVESPKRLISSKSLECNGSTHHDIKRLNNNNSVTNNNSVVVDKKKSEEDLVPTATQLLLRMKPVKPQISEEISENVEQKENNLEESNKKDSFGKKNKLRKSIFQENMFGQKEKSENEDEQSDTGVYPLPLSPPLTPQDIPHASTSHSDTEDEEPFVQIHTNGSNTVHVFEEDPIDELDGLSKAGQSPIKRQTPTAEEEDLNIPSIIDQFQEDPKHIQRCRRTDVNWNLDDLLNHLYKRPEPKPPAVAPGAYINMEGYLEKLPIGRRQGTFWNAWKRRYFKLKDGYLYCSQSSKAEEPILSLQLMGGRIDIVESQILVDDGKGHCIMLRCNSRTDTERWRRALLTHTAENYMLTYAQPVVPYPQFYEKVLIVDIGSCSVRAGILCNQPTLPQIYFPTVCAEEKLTGYRIYGKEALSPKIRLDSNVTFPLRPSAKITKFTVDMIAVKGILTKVFEDLNVDPADYEVQLSLPRSFPFKSQTDVLDLLMTEFGVQGVNLMAQTVLALCSYNTTSGVVVDVGERLEVVPIVDGYVIESGVSRIPYGGSRLMDHLSHFLMQRHYGLSSITESFLLRYVLENSCYCALNYKTELQNFHSQPQNYEVNIPIGHFFHPDEAPWQTISLDGGRFQAPEGLFRPEAWGLDNNGIHKLVWKAIQECSLDVRKEMSRGIYLSGGVTLLPGFTERLQAEMERLSPPTVQPKVHASPYRGHAAYLGACNWALSPGFHQAKISRNEWITNGSSCLKKWHF